MKGLGRLAVVAVVAVAVSLAVQNWEQVAVSGAWGEATRADLALQGWAGAAIGVVGSLAIALIIFWLTQRADERKYTAQLLLERRNFEDQLRQQRSDASRARRDAERTEERRVAHERARGLNERQMDTFAELAAALYEYELNLDRYSADETFVPVLVAYQRWRLATLDGDDRYRDAVGRGVTAVRTAAMQAAARSGSTPAMVKARFQSLGGNESIAHLVESGRRWHLSSEQERPVVVNDLAREFPL